jgi:hypothetical protein
MLTLIQSLLEPSDHVVTCGLRIWPYVINSAVLTRNATEPRFSNSDRLLWIFLRRIWSCWKGALVLLQAQHSELKFRSWDSLEVDVLRFRSNRRTIE